MYRFLCSRLVKQLLNYLKIQFIQYTIIHMVVDKKILNEIISRFIKLYHPQAIYLFGSHAWGTPTSESDLDFCIILNESDLSQVDRIRIGLRILRDVHIPVDLLVLTKMKLWKELIIHRLLFIKCIIRE